MHALGVYEPAEILARRPGYGPKVDGTPGEGTGDIQVLLPRVSDASLVLLLHHAQGTAR